MFSALSFLSKHNLVGCSFDVLVDTKLTIKAECVIDGQFELQNIFCLKISFLFDLAILLFLLRVPAFFSLKSG
jgi:hypothetical protein